MVKTCEMAAKISRPSFERTPVPGQEIVEPVGWMLGELHTSVPRKRSWPPVKQVVHTDAYEIDACVR